MSQTVEWGYFHDGLRLGITYDRLELDEYEMKERVVGGRVLLERTYPVDYAYGSLFVSGTAVEDPFFEPVIFVEGDVGVIEVAEFKGRWIDLRHNDLNNSIVACLGDLDESYEAIVVRHIPRFDRYDQCV